MTDLQLKLTKEAITKAITLVVGSKPHDIHWDSAQAIADAASTKAAWGCVDWLMGQQDDDGFYTEWAMAESMKLFLAAAGIQKP